MLILRPFVYNYLENSDLTFFSLEIRQMTIGHHKEKEQIRLGTLSCLEAKLVSFRELGFHFSLFGRKYFMLKLATPYREEAVFWSV